jgi:dihydrofolate reductase
MNLIVAVDRDWGIGLNNDLLFRIKADLRHFRNLTLGKTIVLGRKTLETFPNGKPLPGRTNIILTRQQHFHAEGAIICKDLPELWTALSGKDPDEIFIIGGASVYELLLPYCHRAYITWIDAATAADCRFPELSGRTDWQLTDPGTWQTEDQLNFRFQIYDKI